MSSMKTPFNVDISVIVPARNEEPYIGRCLDSLVAQDYGGAYEVIVVDGLSEDATAKVMRTYAACAEPVHVLSNPARITPTAFNNCTPSVVRSFSLFERRCYAFSKRDHRFAI